MKTSEILSKALDIYKMRTDLFMCCILDDNYIRHGLPSMGLDKERSLVVQKVIRERIKNHLTLSSYLCVENSDYEQMALVDYKSDECHNFRVMFWHGFIAALESVGE